jgi:CRP-like cAMP-binding protein
MIAIHPPPAHLSVAWFSLEVPTTSQDVLGHLAREYEAPPRRLLLREREETPELSVLVSGRVTLSQEVEGRGPISVATLTPGEVFGWSSLAPPFRATSTVVSLEPVRVVAFEATGLRAALRADSVLAAHVYQQLLGVVAHRLRITRELLLDPSDRDSIEPWSSFFG